MGRVWKLRAFFGPGSLFSKIHSFVKIDNLFTVGKSGLNIRQQCYVPKSGLLLKFSKKLPETNNRPIREKSPNHHPVAEESLVCQVVCKSL
jgi:hypothetical protein